MKQPSGSSVLDWEYECTNCGRGFDTRMAYEITIQDAGTATLMCSWCRHTDQYRSPDESSIERPPSVTSITRSMEIDGRSGAKIEFENGTRVQFTTSTDGTVSQETVDSTGRTLSSRRAGRDAPPDAAPAIHAERLLEAYRRYTVRGLGIQRPHLAVGLLEEY